MKVRAYIILSLVVLLPLVSIGQKAIVRKADRHFKRLQYVLAIPLYETSVKSDTTYHSRSKLAESYMKTHQYDLAIENYQRLSKEFPRETFYYLNYGLLLKNKKEYQKAKVLFKRYLRDNIDEANTDDVLDLIRSCGKVNVLYENPKAIYILNTNVNSEYNDFSPIIFNDEMIFCSSRKSTVDREYHYDGQSFINFYRAKRITESEFEEPVLYESLNGRFHEGPAIYSEHYKTLFLTRNNEVYNAKKNDNTNKLKIYYSNYVGEEFEKAKEFQHNSEEYSIGHPAVTPDGTKFYFASDMPGGYGKTDLYVCYLTNKGWSKPVNLGPEVNTSGKEMFPFAINDTTLYFSSDRHEGLGGLDIFSVDLFNNKAYGLTNVGAPINSEKDDFGFFLEDKKAFKGYFSSNRDTTSKSDDIYLFKRAHININCLVIDSLTYKKIPYSKVRITSKSGLTRDLFTDKDGKAVLDMSPNREFTLTFSKRGYKTKRIPFSTHGLKEESDTSFVVELVVGEELDFKGKVVDKQTLKPIPDASIVMQQPQDGYLELLVSNKNGGFEFSGEEGKKVKLEVSKEGYFTGKLDVDKIDPGKEVVIKLDKIVLDQVLDIEPIYYDFDKWDITPRSEAILNKIIAIMKDNPDISIELKSHTDIRGSFEYNHNLSIKRANSAINYVVSNGIDRFRLTYSVFGETKVAVPCPPGEDCDEDVHSWNRRTEFKIISF